MKLPEFVKDTHENRKWIRRIGKIIQPEIELLEDGFYYWFPKCRGCYGSNELRVVAWYLDELNKKYEQNIEDYFNGERKNANLL